jgi:DnaJ like chaperone protein
MGIFKWIAGFLGFIISGGSPLAALAGYALGSLLEGGVDVQQSSGYWQNQQSSGGYDGYERRQRVDIGQRNSFLFSLLVLASYIIRADGKVMHSEMEFLRSFLRANFGEQAVVEGNEIVNRLFEKQKEMENQRRGSYRDIVMQSCEQMANNMTYEQRLQLLSFLAQLVKADGIVDGSEVQALRDVAMGLRLSASEVDSMLNLKDSSTNLDAAYKVLGVSPDATDDEVRKAYRALALKHHPDRVATLGEDVKRAAEKKFQEINAAKELVFKARGM